MTGHDRQPLQPPHPARTRPRVSRREFLRLGAAVGGAVAIGGALVGCDAPTPTVTVEPTPLPLLERYEAVAPPPAEPPSPAILRFFTEHEAATVEAITARILPGTPEDPGAREAGVVTYIDHLLSQGEGFGQPVYRQGPFARLYEGDEPPPEAAEADPEEEVWVAADEIGRYGYQSPLTPQEVYRMGLPALDAYAQEEFGADFVDLSEGEQDMVVEALAEGEASGFEPFTGQQLFHVLRRHTKEGMFSDPLYGGNRGLVGWRLVGYPGAQRAYSPEEVQMEGIEREPWGLADLPPFHYARPRDPTPAAPARGTGGEAEDEGDSQGNESQ